MQRQGQKPKTVERRWTIICSEEHCCTIGRPVQSVHEANCCGMRRKTEKNAKFLALKRPVGVFELMHQGSWQQVDIWA